MTDEQLKKIQWLERAKEANKSAERKHAVYENKKAEVAKLKNAYKMGGDGNSAKRNTIEAKILDMLNAEREWHEKAEYVEMLKSEILSEIKKIPDELLADILKARFVDFCTHEQTAGAVNYSVQSVKRLYKKALDALKVETL